MPPLALSALLPKLAMLTAAEISSALADYPDWSVVDGAIQRVFTFNDHFDVHDLANLIAFHAEEEDHHPDLELTYKKLKIRLKTHDKNAITKKDIEFVEWLEKTLKFREAAKILRNPRPAKALLRLWQEAQQRWEDAIAKLSQDDLYSPLRKGESRNMLELTVRHPTASAFGYLAWIRKNLGIGETGSGVTRKDVDAMPGLPELKRAIAALKVDAEFTLGKLYQGIMVGRTFMSNWGAVYDIEGMLEHAVMHFHRHRLQIEDFLAGKATA